MLGCLKAAHGLALVLGAVCLSSMCRGQCEGRLLPAQGTPGPDGDVFASVVWDPDGAGPAGPLLVVGGEFRVAGGAVSPGVAAWDGAAWRALGEGLSGTVRALAVYRGDLYAAGFVKVATEPLGWEPTASFTRRWNGVEWESIGGGGTGGHSRAYAMTVFDDHLILGGEFWEASGSYAPHVQAWDGATWTSWGQNSFAVSSFAEFRGSLYAGNLHEGGVRVWNGASWSLAGASYPGTVFSLAVFRDELIVGGEFTAIGGTAAARLAAWNGGAWRAISSGMDAPVCVLAVHHDELFAGGDFMAADGVHGCRIACWNGSSWRAMGEGSALTVNAISEFQGDLYLGTDMGNCRPLSSHTLTRWDGSAWRPVGAGFDANINGVVEWNGGLIAGGDFGMAGDGAARFIARWDGAEWGPLGAGVDNRVYAVGTFRGKVIAAGHFLFAGGAGADWSPYIAAWNGTSWHGLGGGVNQPVYSVCEFGGDLIAAGGFSTAGGLSIKRVARWDGGTWNPMGSLDGYIPALRVFGGVLYAAGRPKIGGAQSVAAQWDGVAWRLIGTSAESATAIAEHEGSLVVGHAHGSSRWDGSVWQPMPGETTPVYALAVADGALLAGTGKGVLRWGGQAWEPFAPANDAVLAMLERGGELALGGQFTAMNGVGAGRFARLAVEGLPSIALQPEDSGPVCPGSDGVFRVAPAPGDEGATYRWQRGELDGSFSDVVDGPTPWGSTIIGGAKATLIIAGAKILDGARYRCIVSNGCGGVASDGAELTLCVADVDCNSFVNGDDFDVFVVAFEAGDLSADINADGFTNGDDFDLFAAAFDAGC